jgi:hypothetical protein
VTHRKRRISSFRRGLYAIIKESLGCRSWRSAQLGQMVSVRGERGGSVLTILIVDVVLNVERVFHGYGHGVLGRELAALPFFFQFCVVIILHQSHLRYFAYQGSLSSVMESRRLDTIIKKKRSYHSSGVAIWQCNLSTWHQVSSASRWQPKKKKSTKTTAGIQRKKRISQCAPQRYASAHTGLCTACRCTHNRKFSKLPSHPIRPLETSQMPTPRRVGGVVDTRRSLNDVCAVIAAQAGPSSTPPPVHPHRYRCRSSHISEGARYSLQQRLQHCPIH